MLIEKVPPASRRNAETELLGSSPAAEDLRQVIRKVARTQATILIRGEYGTCQQLVARSLHRQSPRAGDPLFHVDCAKASAAELDCELFGREQTVGTGVTAPEPGAFELANGGTVLLEEIGAVSAGIQAKLLRLLQEGTLERVGGKQPLKIDVRILATTHRDLEAKVRREEFREDLFLRLNIVPVQLPSLRDQKDDISAWADHFRVSCARRLGIDAPTISSASWTAFERHSWPGNIQELQQRIEVAVVAAAGSGTIEPAHLGFVVRSGAPAPASLDKSRNKETDKGTDAVNALEEMEKRHIYTVLDRCQWNRGNAADLLGISIRTLRNKLKEYGRGEASESPERQP